METNDKRLEIGGNNPPITEVLADTRKDLIAQIEPLAERANNAPQGIKDDHALSIVAELVTDAKQLSGKLEAARKEDKQPYLDGGRAVDAFFSEFTNRLDRIATVFTSAASDYQRVKAVEARRKAEDEARKLREDEAKKREEAEKAKRESTAERKHDEADEIAAKADAAEAMAASTNHTLTKVKTETGVTTGAKTEWTFDIVDYEKIPLERLRPYFQRSEVEKAIRSFVKINKGSSVLAGVTFREDIKATFRR